MGQTEPPVLSVVIAVTAGSTAVRRVLGELAAQRGGPPPEVIVVDGTGALAMTDLASFPGETRLLAAHGADVAVLRALGARAAHGQLVAFTEDLCQHPDNWCAELLRAYAAGRQAFGGAIENGPFRGPSNWAAYLVEFGAFMPPLRAGPANALPGMNAAYERALLEDLPDPSLCEPFVNQRLREQGVRLFHEPALVVRLATRFGVRAFTRHCFAGGRTFARQRLDGARAERRVGYALMAATIVPLLHICRAGAQVLVRRRARLPFVFALPWIALYAASWGLGEAAGAITVRPAQPRVQDASA